MSYVARSTLTAERETLRGLVSAISGLMEGVSAMSKYEYLANLTEIATEIAQVACSVNPFQALMAYNETGPRISRLVHSRRLDFIYEKA